jgi:hypothetical protein
MNSKHKLIAILVCAACVAAISITAQVGVIIKPEQAVVIWTPTGIIDVFMMIITTIIALKGGEA